MKLLLLMILQCIFTLPTFAYTIYVDSTPIYYDVIPAKGVHKADFLYLHGFADATDNHHTLFNELTQAGIRVISFDFPGHGKSGGSINFTSFDDLAQIAAKVEASVGAEPSFPLFLGGWSTGGLLATAIIQKEVPVDFSRNVQALVLYAPGVSVKKCVGNFVCHVTNETLTHNTSLYSRRIVPASPLRAPLFAAKILFHSLKAFHNPNGLYGTDVMVVTAGRDDQYVKSDEVTKWAQGLRHANYPSTMWGLKCPTACHELDNELAVYGGEQVRKATVEYLLYKLHERRSLEVPAGPCFLF